jgi:hypothetical protein
LNRLKFSWSVAFFGHLLNTVISSSHVLQTEQLYFVTYWWSVSLASLPKFPLFWVSSSVHILSLPTLRRVTVHWWTVVGRFCYHVSAFWTPYNPRSLYRNAKQHISSRIRNFKITALLDVTPCSLMGVCGSYGRIFCLHR